MATKADDQTSFDERIIEDKGLEEALEDRERAKGAKAEATRTYKTKDDVVKGRLNEKGLEEDQPYRVGRFRIRKTIRKGKSVSFDTADSERLSIGPVDPDDE